MKHSIIILQFLLLLSSAALQAGTETVNSRISGSQIHVNSAVFVQDNSYPNVEVAGVTKVVSANSKVIFSIDNASPLYYNAFTAVKLGLKIYSFDKNGIAQALPGIIELEVGYSPTTSYKDKSVYVVNGSHKINAIIQYIKDANNVVIPAASIPQNLSLELEQTTERYYLFNTSTPPSFVGRYFLASSNELDIHWDVLAGAEEYELEWTYVNDYDKIAGIQLLGDHVFCNFKDNCTRIRLSQTHYPVSLVFDQGYVVFRVRGIGRSFTDLTKELSGAWSAAESGMIDPTFISSNYPITPGIRHEKSKNWQYSATYAEEGKKKEVVSYFDGSLRNRQSVTKLNTDNKILVGETMYDYQGRSAIQVLPTPTTESTIKFYPGFNKNFAGDASYSRKDFDEDAGSNCVTTTSGMNTITGSSNYYSSANNNKTGCQAYVPDANQYPFSQVEFSPDNTGRIRRQSGVGIEHQLGSGHETQYFYSQPEQIQLDRLFGTEAGDYQHYKKNMVIDANGQISVSYLNQEGKVIATSLAGDSTLNLNALPSEHSASTQLTINYIKANDSLVPNSNKRIDNALVFSKELSVATKGYYDFYYDIEAPHFQEECLPNPICYNCVYDLEITITDACGASLITPVKQKVGTMDTVCNGADIKFSLEAPPIHINLMVGSYTVSKKLTINETAIDFYTDNYIRNNTCITPYDSFLVNALARVDTTACDISCEQCVLSLGSYTFDPEHPEKGPGHDDAAKADPLSATYNPDYAYFTREEFDKAIKECKAPCEPANLCEAEYQTLLADVSPSGQYANYDANGISLDPLSVFNISSSLPDGASAYWRNPLRNGLAHYYEEDGSISTIIVVPVPGGYTPAVPSTATIMSDGNGNLCVYPEQLANALDFINEFGNHPDWAKSLVEYHPEYPYYKWCINNNTPGYSEASVSITNGTTTPLTSDAFDDLLRSKNTAQDAIDALLLNNNDPLDLLNKDPYFNSTTSTVPTYPNNGQGASQQPAMAALLTNYNGIFNPSLKIMCSRVAQCGTVYYGTPIDCDVFLNGTLAEVDQKWILYRNIYLAEKQKLQQQAANVSATLEHNSNGCIGVGTAGYNPWAFGAFSWTVANSDPCGYATWFLYKDKIKRFQNGADAMNGVEPFADQQTALNTLANTADYNMYLETGQCPVTVDLGFLLDNLAQQGKLVSQGLDLVNNTLFTKRLYDALTPNPSATSFIHYNWVSSVTGSVLTAQFTGSTACPLTLTLPAGYSWGDVKKLANIHFINQSGGNYNFTITAFIDANPMDAIPPVQVLVTGSTCMKLNSCSFPENCGASAEALRIQNLLNGLISNSQLEVNNVDLKQPPYATLYTNDFTLPSGVTLNSMQWNGSATGSGSLDYTRSDGFSNQCGFSFTFTKTAFALSDVQYFAHIRPDLSNPTNFYIDAWVGDHFEPMSVTNASGCFNYKKCAPPPNLGSEPCTQKTFVNKLTMDFDASIPAFTSSRTYASTCSLSRSDYYYVVNNVQSDCSGYSCGGAQSQAIGTDNTNPGTGKFLLFNFYFGAPQPEDLFEKTINGILPDKDYVFSYWIQRCDDECWSPWIAGNLRLAIDGVQENTIVPQTNHEWELVTKTWNSGNNSTGTVTLKISSTMIKGILGIDDIKFEQVETVPCTPASLAPSLILPYVNPCVKNLKDLAAANAKNSYNSYIEIVKDSFRVHYMETCKNAMENLKMVYTDKEYHFTLYYYDQAGNLIKTVPPEGVVLVTDANDLDQIALDRLNKAHTFFTKHTLQTRYEYNSLNQLIRQATPDNELMNNDYSSRFWYDRLGRLVVSQNTKQFNKTPKAYSYTKYDTLGRIIEVGETAIATDIASLTNTHGVIGDDDAFIAWLAAGIRTEITSTLYDDLVSPAITGFTQENLRKRVSATFIDDNGDGTNEQGSLFSYDIHGNVKSLLQENKALENVIANGVKQSLKRIDYEYDLVSGKVNQVSYQDGQPDAFYHKYEYDADNRITNVYTSKDNVIWEQDAKYFYYLHGPLARVELGDNKVQGMDYAYTIQGWVKGVNSNILNSNNDIGKDGETSVTNLNRNIAKDAFGYSLNYFTNDYKAIDPNKNLTANSFIASITAAAYLQTDAPDLYNGNISSMVTSIADIAFGSPTLGQAIPQLSAFKYDQLNRVKQMKAYRDISLANNTWAKGAGYDGSYETHLSYDANGNITRMSRNGLLKTGASPLEMDDLTYTYENIANGYARNTNKLLHVNDNRDYTGNYRNDIDDQEPFSTGNENYAYDEIGNQIQDKSEDIAHQEWNVYGKVKSISRYTGSTKPDLEFTYNASGHRISKTVKPRDSSGQRPVNEWITTHYVKDAQGNTLAVYEESYNQQALPVSFKLKERYMYGSSRLGADKTEIEMIDALALRSPFSRIFGKKNYDLENYRGDIISVVTDRKIAVEDPVNTGTITYFKPEIITTNETYLFGMPEPGRNIGLSNERHGYQGQEKVDEINNKPGTHYTADKWELNTLTGRRENGDPVKKLWQSDYVIFSNNPVWKVDPNGTDDFEINKKGNVVKRTENKKADNFFGVNDEGKRIKDKTISLAYGSIKSVQNEKIRVQNADGKIEDKPLTLFNVKGDENAKQLFEFVADFSGEGVTDIEWSHAKVGTEKSGSNVVGTMHTPGASGIGGFLLSKNYSIRELNHSHPNGTGYTSAGDEDNAKKYLKANKNTILNIYVPRPNVPDGLYLQYNEKGLIKDEPNIYMEAIDIDGK